MINKSATVSPKRVSLTIIRSIRIWFPLILACLITQPAAATGLDLSSVEQVRVLLFELDPASRLTISAYEGSIGLEADPQIEQNDDHPAFAIEARNGSVVVSHPSRNYQTNELTLTADDTGLIRIFHPRLGIRYYRGKISITAQNNKLRLINTVHLEDYIGSVVGGEMNFPEMEALKVQAVIARTYALWSLAHSNNNRREYDLTDHTLNQVYHGVLISRPDYLEAALSTSGEIVTWSNKLILAAYSSTCGGITSDNESIWSGDALPYLRSVSDGGSCSKSPHFAWEYRVKRIDLLDMLRRQTGRYVQSISISESDRHNRVTRLTLHIAGGDETVKTANNFRLMVNNNLSSNSLRSTRFTLDESDDYLIFVGKGLGHGIGLCQWGARGLAQAGWNYRDILKLYYSGVEIIDFHTLETGRLELAR